MKMSVQKTLLLFISILSLFHAKGHGEWKQGIEEFDVNGIQVILKPSYNEVISAKLFIKGGTKNYQKQMEGIESLALKVITNGGTEHTPKGEFLDRLDRLASSINSVSSLDYGIISLKCIYRNWDQSWNLFAEAIMKPAFSQKEFVLIKDQLITQVSRDGSDPDTKLRNLSMEDVFKGHPYSRNPQGTAESLESLSLEEVKSYYTKVLTKSRCLLVVVGKITKKDLTHKLNETLAEMPAGNYKPHPLPPLNITTSSIGYTDSDIATNYIRGIMNGPDISSKDVIAMQFAFSIFRDRMFEEIRTKRNLSYAPSAFFAPFLTTYCGIYVSTEYPDSALKVMIREIKLVKDKGFEDSEINNKKGQFLTRFYMDQETNSSQATSLGAAEIKGGWEQTLTFVEDINQLTLDEINIVFDKYTKAIKWYYVGKKEHLPTNIHLEVKPNRPY